MVSDSFIGITSNIVSSETGFIPVICLVENIHHSKLKALYENMTVNQFELVYKRVSNVYCL